LAKEGTLVKRVNDNQNPQAIPIEQTATMLLPSSLAQQPIDQLEGK